MSLGSIIVDLLMRTGSFQTDTARAGKSLKKLEAEALAVGKAIGAALGAAGLGALVKSAIDSLDALNDASDITGATVENLSALESVARRNGGTLEDVTGILVKFNKALKDADGKNGVSLAFKALGLDIQKLKADDPALAIQKVAIALQGFADDGQKARLVQELFGKSIKDAAPFLKDLADAGQLNATATTEQARAAEEFNRSINALKTDLGEFVRDIVGNLLPAMNDLITKFKEARAFSGGGRLFEELDKLFGDTPDQALRDQADRITTEANRVTTAIQSMQEELNRQGGGNPRLVNSIEKSRAKLAELQKQARATTAQLQLFAEVNTPKDKTPGDIAAGLIAGGTSRRPSLPDVGGKGKKAAAERQSEAERYLETLEKQLEKTQELSVFEQAVAEITKGRLKGLNDELQAYILAVAGEIDLEKQAKKEEKERAEIAEDMFRAKQRLGESASREAESIEELNKRMREEIEVLGLSKDAIFAVDRARISSAIALKEEALAAEQAKGADTEFTYALERQIAALREQQGLLSERQGREFFIEDLKKMKDEAEQLRGALRDNFADAFASFLDGSKSAGDAFKSFANSVLADLARIQARKIAMQIFGDENGNGGFDWASLFSSFTGSGTSGSIAGGSASGGLTGGGAGAPLGKMGPSATKIVIENHGAEIEQRSEAVDGGLQTRLIVRMVEGVIARQSRPGGVIRQGLRQQPPKRG